MVSENSSQMNLSSIDSDPISSSDSEDSVPNMTDEQADRMRNFLAQIGLMERQQKKIRESTLARWDDFQDHIVYGVTRGCAQRMHKNSDDPDKQPKFTLYDTLHQPSGEDRIFKFANPSVLTKRPELDDMIINEHSVIERLDHPNIVKTRGLLRKGIISYLVLEYLPYNIAEIIGTKPDLQGAAFFLSESAKAIQYLHSQGVVHGDIKPAQFMGGYAQENPKYRVLKLLDFTGAIHPELPLPPRLPYTPGYAAPEVIAANGTKDADSKIKAFSHKADIYSLGISYAKVALRSAAKPDEISAVFNDPTLIAERVQEAMCLFHLPFRFAALIKDMTAPNPSDRPNIEEVMPHVEEFCMFNRLYDVTEITRDLYSGEVTKIKVTRPF